MSGATGKRAVSVYLKKVQAAKDKLQELAIGKAGDDPTAQEAAVNGAFREVRLLHNQEGVTWLDAYETVTRNLEAKS
jgi:hypothetical protein